MKPPVVYTTVFASENDCGPQIPQPVLFNLSSDQGASATNFNCLFLLDILIFRRKTWKLSGKTKKSWPETEDAFGLQVACDYSYHQD